MALLLPLLGPAYAGAAARPAEGVVVAFLPAGFGDTGEVALLPDLADPVSYTHLTLPTTPYV